MFVSKNKHNELQEKYEALQEQMNEKASESEEKIEELLFENEQLKRHNEELKKENIIGDKNQVTLTISDDLQTITPVIKFKETANDILLKNGYATGTSDMQTQLGLMIVADEALNQIVSSFTEDIKED
jgi:predicted nuclease with TOPRIM domain